MNYNAIKNIYTNVLKFNDTIKYLGGDKYKFVGYYKNGNKYWEIEYKNGIRHSKYISWDENGNKSWEREYQNGKKIK